MLENPNDDRLPQRPIKTVEDLCEKIKAYHPSAPIQIIEKAYQFSEKGAMRERLWIRSEDQESVPEIEPGVIPGIE